MTKRTLIMSCSAALFYIHEKIGSSISVTIRACQISDEVCFQQKSSSFTLCQNYISLKYYFIQVEQFFFYLGRQNSFFFSPDLLLHFYLFVINVSFVRSIFSNLYFYTKKNSICMLLVQQIGDLLYKHFF